MDWKRIIGNPWVMFVGLVINVASVVIWLNEYPTLVIFMSGGVTALLVLGIVVKAVNVWRSGVIQSDAQRWWSACLAIYRSDLARQYLMGFVMLGGVTLFAGFMGTFLATNLAELAILLANWVP